MAFGTPMSVLQTVFLGVTSVGSAPWAGSFVDSIRSVYYLSTIFLLVAIIPSVMRGRMANSVHSKDLQTPSRVPK